MRDILINKSKLIGLLSYGSRRLATICFVTSLIVLSACNSNASFNTYYYDGDLNEEKVSKAIEYINSNKNIDIFSIKSVGGDYYQSYRLVKSLNYRNIEVEVRDICASACMSYVFLGAKKKRVKENAILAFHYAPGFDYLYLKNKVDISQLTTSKQMQETVTELYKESGTSLEILTDNATALQPLCWISKQVQHPYARVLFSHMIWIPSYKYLQSRGVNFDNNAHDIEQNLSNRYDFVKSKLLQYVNIPSEEFTKIVTLKDIERIDTNAFNNANIARCREGVLERH